MHYISASEKVLAMARKHLLEFGYCKPGLLKTALARSWERSLLAGLNGAQKPEKLSPSALRDAQEKNHDLLALAKPIMASVAEQIKRSNSMLVLADKSCSLIHTVGDSGFLDKAAQVALSEGANWQEQCVGTNALGLALSEQTPIEVHGAEHFLERNGFLHCAAVPVFSAKGDIAGVLDISSDKHQHNAHTLGLAKMAASMIENAWICAAHPVHFKLYLHAAPQGVRVFSAGLLLISEDGTVDGGNQEAMQALALSAGDFGVRSIASVLDIDAHNWLSQLQQASAAKKPIHSRLGGRLYVLLEPTHESPKKLIRDIGKPYLTVLKNKKQTVGQLSALRSMEDALSPFDLGDARWRQASDKMRRVLDKSIAVLIQGESGCGKEQFARAAHASSARKNKPFVAINCAAIPESLIEAELFGYAPGAFSGARKEGQIGRLRQADGGTLFLDEIGDMPLALQARLLRVLQDHVVTPLGGGADVVVDFALICASHRNLPQAIEQGSFRADLYYRINGLTIHLPALRERQDFDALAQQILTQLQADARLQPAFADRARIGISHAVLNAMRHYSWPGNVRQLHSVLRTACALLDAHENEIDWHHLPDDIAEALQSSDATVEGLALVHSKGHSYEGGLQDGFLCSKAAQAHPSALSADNHAAQVELAEQAILPTNLETLSQQAIATALRRTGGNISRAAKELGISRQTLHRRLSAAKGV